MKTREERRQLAQMSKHLALRRREAIEQTENPLMPAFLQDFMEEKQREAATQLEGFKQLEMMRQIADSDRRLKHQIHDVEEMHGVVLDSYRSKEEVLKSRRDHPEAVDPSPNLLQAHRVQQNILNLQYQIDKVKGCLQEAKKLKEMKQ